MPLVKIPHTDAERKALIDAGVNPEDYEQEINTDDYEPIKAPPLSLTPSPSTIPSIPTSPTPLGSGLRAFGANVLPASAGVFTGTLAPLALGVVNPIAGIGATVLGGVGGYAGMKKLQDTLMPFSWEQKLERDKRENPGAVTIGNIAAQLPTMRPSIKGILDTIKGVSNLARSKATVDEVNAVRNTMLGAGMGAAGSVVGDVKPFVTGDLSAWDLTKNTARAAILGSLFNTPTALGSKLGQAATKAGQEINFKFKPTLEPTVEDPTSVMPRVEPNVNAPKETLPVIDATVTEDFHTPESKVAAEEVQAKTAKMQEDAAKLQEEAARLKAEHDIALAAKEKAAQDLVVQSKEAVKAPTTSEVSTPATSNPSFERYNLITQEMKSYDFDTPEFQRLWHEKEKIKNANGGMPPTASVKPVEDEKKVEEPIVTIPEPSENSPQPFQTPTQPSPVSEVPKATSVESEGAKVTKHEAEQFPLKLEDNKNSDIPTPPVIPPSSGSGSGSEPPIIPPSSPVPYDKPEPYEVQQDKSKQGLVEALAPQFDKVRKHNVRVAEAFHNTKVDQDALTGRFVNQPLEALMKTEVSEEVMTLAMKKMNKAYRDEVIKGIKPPADIGLTDKEKEVQAIISKVNAEIPQEAKKRNISIGGFFTADSLKPSYIPASVKPEIIYETNRDPHSIEAKRYARSYAEYLQENFPLEFPYDAEGYTKARKQWTDYIAALNSKRSQAPSDFGPLHKAQGYGLPEELQDWNLPRVISKYGHRSAQDMAIHTNMKTVPEVAGPLKLRHQGNGKLITEDPRHTDISGTDEVKGAWKHLTGDFDYGNPTLATTSRLITSHMIGLMTGVGDVVSVPMNMVPYMNRMGDLAASVKGLMSLKDAFNRAIAVNATQRKLDIRLWANMETPGRPVLSALQTWADWVRYLSLREATDQLSRVIPFSIGREMAKVRIMDYHKTKNEESREWLEKFGRNIEGGIESLNPDDPNIREKIEQIAKNFSDRVAGSYGGDQLSAGVMEGQAAPFTTLAKWSLAKQNVIFQDVIKPVYTYGNIGPLLRYMFIGMPLAYAAYTALQEFMTHRKMQSPNLKEVMEKGNAADKVAYLANVMAVTSAGGIASYPLKAATDITIRHTTPTFSLNNPMITFMSEGVVKTLKDVSEALAESEDPLHVWGNAAMSLVKHSVQNARMVLNQTADREQNERSNKIRDLNVFNELGDAKDNPDRNTMAKEIGLASNPLLKRDEKDFKNESDLEKAKAMIPDLIKKIDKEANGDPMRRHKLILGLMNSKDPTFPSLHTTPEQANLAIKYAKYLADVYGKEEALSRLRDAEKLELIQQAKKGELIKSFMSDTNFVSGSSKR